MAFPISVRIATLARNNVFETSETASNKDIFDFDQKKLIRIFASKLRFSYELVSPPDYEFGRLLPSGNWSGLVGMVERGEADIIIHRLGITEERSSAIDFTTPYEVNRFTFVTTNPEPITDMGSFLSPFYYEVWYCILFYVLVHSFTVFALRNAEDRHRKKTLKVASMKKPRNVGQNLLAASYAFAEMFLRHFYAGLLLAFLTFPRLTGVRTLEELSRAIVRGTHQCAIPPGSFIEKYLLKSNDANLRIIGKSLSKYVGSADFVEALGNSTHAVRVAFVGAESRFLALSGEYFVFKEPFLHTMAAVGLKKGFCCKAHLDSLINYLWASGIYYKLVKDAAFKVTLRNRRKQSFSDSPHRSLSVDDFAGVFILLTAGHTLAVVVLFLELAIFKYFKRAKV